MKEIQVLAFEGEVVLDNGTPIVISGREDGMRYNSVTGSQAGSQAEPVAEPARIFSVPLGNFQVVDGKKGKARVMITNPLDMKGMQALAKDSSYVVEEIRFEPSDRIQVRITPRSVLSLPFP